MKKITLNSIRSQNIKTIFDIIVKEGRIARSEIAKLSNLSLMTVSNIVDHLDRFDIILHDSREQTSMVGRKAELLSINSSSRKIVIMDLTSLKFSFVVLNLDLSVHYTCNNWSYNQKDSYKANLVSFLSSMKEYLDVHSEAQEIIGIGVSVPGPYDVTDDMVISKRIKELMYIPLKSVISSILLDGKPEDCDIFIDEDVKFAALANIVMVPEYRNKTVFYIYIGEGVGGAISINGNVLRGAYSFAGDIGQVLADDNANFEERISLGAFEREVQGNPDKFNEEFEKFCKYVASALYNVIWFIDPHAIILECEYAGLNREGFLENLNTRLSQMLPEKHVVPELILSNRSIKDANIGAGITLRNRWLESIS
mgnify:CR=1 FL=1